MKQWIENGTLPDGQPLPTEQILAEKLAVSRGTLRSALSELTEAGFVRADGKRTRIAVKPDGVVGGLGVENSELEAQSVRIGVIGAWTGQADEYIWNNAAARAIEKVASEDARVTLCYFNRFVGHHEPRLSVREGLATLGKQGVDRFALLFRTEREEIEALGAEMDFQKTPLVCIQDESPHNLPICQIYYDLEHSGYQAADHLLRRGWRSLVVFAPFEANWVWQRLEGIKSAIRMHGFSPDQILTVWPTEGRQPAEHVEQGWFQRIGREVGRELLLNLDYPCGIIAPNDMTAYGVLEAAKAANLSPGIHFGMIGFDDSMLSREYGLSSLRPPIEAMSEGALRLLLPDAPQQLPLRLSFRSELIARTSSDFYTPTASVPAALTSQGK